jgi:hypothetical protein
MEFDKAQMFKGSFGGGVLVDGDGQPDPRGYKMIRIEMISESESVLVPAADKNRCIACSYKAVSEKDLEEHCKATHASQLVFDEEADRELKLKEKRKKDS